MGLETEENGFSFGSIDDAVIADSLTEDCTLLEAMCASNKAGFIASSS